MQITLQSLEEKTKALEEEILFDEKSHSEEFNEVEKALALSMEGFKDKDFLNRLIQVAAEAKLASSRK